MFFRGDILLQIEWQLCCACVKLSVTPWTAAPQVPLSMVLNSLQPHGLQPLRFLSPWDSPGKNSVVGCHGLLQGIFETQGSKLNLLCLLYWQAGSLVPAWEAPK